MRDAEPFEPRAQTRFDLTAPKTAQVQSKGGILIDGGIKQQRFLKHIGHALSDRESVG